MPTLSKFTKRLLAVAAAFGIVSCESMTRKPALPPQLKLLDDVWLAVRFQPASDTDAAPHVALIDTRSSSVIAREVSLFTNDVVKALGPPTGNRLIVHMSANGNTIAAWENATESAPDEQIVLFTRERLTDENETWHARRVFPPFLFDKPYSIYARPVSVDDEFLYFTLDGGPMEKERLTSLKQVPKDHKHPSEEAKTDKEKDKDKENEAPLGEDKTPG